MPIHHAVIFACHLNLSVMARSRAAGRSRGVTSQFIYFITHYMYFCIHVEIIGQRESERRILACVYISVLSILINLLSEATHVKVAS